VLLVRLPQFLLREDHVGLQFAREVVLDEDAPDRVVDLALHFLVLVDLRLERRLVPRLLLDEPVEEAPAALVALELRREQTSLEDIFRELTMQS